MIVLYGLLKGFRLHSDRVESTGLGGLGVAQGLFLAGGCTATREPACTRGPRGVDDRAARNAA